MKTREVNFTKYKLIPFINNTYTNCHVDENKKQITVYKNENIQNLYRYSELDKKEKLGFLFIKYFPVLIFLYSVITAYELQNHQLDIILAFFATSLGLITNLRYNDKLSFIVTCVWFLFFYFITDIHSSSMIAKYTLTSFLIYQFVFDLNRKYYAIFDKDDLVSYAFIKRQKI